MFALRPRLDIGMGWNFGQETPSRIRGGSADVKVKVKLEWNSITLMNRSRADASNDQEICSIFSHCAEL